MLNILKPFYATYGLLLKIIVAIFSVLFVVLKARQSGKDANRVDNLKATLKGMRVRDEIENDINSSGDVEYNRLLDKWRK